MFNLNTVTQPRLSHQLAEIVPPDDLENLNVRGTIVRLFSEKKADMFLEQPAGDISLLRTGRKMKTQPDTEKFSLSVRERIHALTTTEAREASHNHVLLKHIEKVNPLMLEGLFWDFKLEDGKELNPDAAQKILQSYQMLQQLPVEAHNFFYPLVLQGYLLGHSTRVAVLTALIADEIDEDPKLAAQTGFWHDFGKLEPEQKRLTEIQGKFTPEQYEKIKKHPGRGAIVFEKLWEEQLLNISNGDYHRIYHAILEHHVRPDGKGYPDRIMPHFASAESQRVAVADAYDAIITRSHRHGKSDIKERAEYAISELKKYRGKQFTPGPVDAFLRVNLTPVIKKPSFIKQDKKSV